MNAELPARSFRSDSIRVLVGTEEQAYTIHRDIICAKVPFFEKCLNSGCVEAVENEVKLPDDEPEVFDEVAKFVYSGGITVPLDHTCEDSCEENCDEGRNTKQNNDRTLALVKLYILGDKLCMEELCNLVSDVIQDRHKNRITSALFLTALQDAGLSECPLTKFLIRQLADDICKLGFAKVDSAFDEGNLPAFFEWGGIEPHLVVKRMSDMCSEVDSNDFPAEPSKAEPCCMHHQHRDTPKCAEETEGSPVSGKRKRVSKHDEQGKRRSEQQRGALQQGRLQLDN